MASSELYVNPYIWPNYSEQNMFSATQRNVGGELGKDQFLQILVAQLKYQDPLQPMQDREFIAQMAQFSAVEQMTNVANEVRLMRQSLGTVSSLIGKSIQWLNEEGESKAGVVEAITIKEGKQYLVVDGEEVSPEHITKVWTEE